MCPVMKLLPAGKFVLATPIEAALVPSGSASAPTQIEITFTKPFAMGVYDVTRAEYAAFVKETNFVLTEGCQTLVGNRWIADPKLSWKNPGFRQTEHDPVVCISWDDAHAYVRWLNTKVHGGASGQGTYHLPSGSEWEYAARGGIESATETYWGRMATHEDANYGLDLCFPCGVSKQGRDRWYFTSPVGAFPPNVFGLYDTLGDVWQQTDDCYQPTFAGMPLDGSAWQTGDCRLHTLRGGSFDDPASTISLVPRNPFLPSVRNYANGFRVARSLP
jgi:formylglycine-generating enzyme required for sulfatase activity